MVDFRRKRHRLSPQSYRGRQAHFVTLCTAGRQKVFVDPVLTTAIVKVLGKTCMDHAFGVYAYCFMPDHVHLILTGEDDSSDLPAAVRALKGASAVAARKIGLCPLWQKGFYDHVLRSTESMDAAAWYVFMNPVRAGLARRVEDWAHSGSFVFDWKRPEPWGQPFKPPWKAIEAKAQATS